MSIYETSTRRDFVVDKSGDAGDELDLYFTAFKRLDRLVNQFFATYVKVVYPSYKMSLLWEGVMYCRTHLVNAIAHMKDEHQYLDSAYIPDRILEVREYVHNLRAAVSRALSLLVAFIGTVCSDTADWDRERDFFNTKLALEIKDKIYDLCRKWRQWLSELYGIGAKTKAAYELHLEEQELLNKRRLFNREVNIVALSLGKFQEEFKARFGKLTPDNATELRPRMLLFKLEDVLTFFTPPKDGGEVMTPTDNSLAEKLKKVLTGLMTLKTKVAAGLEQHNLTPADGVASLEELQSMQFSATYQGLTDIGPFGIAPLDGARSKFKVFEEKQDSDGVEKVVRYLELEDDKELGQFEDLFGTERAALRCKLTELSEVTLTSRKQRNGLGIPKNAEFYAWVFPCVNASKVAQVEKEPSLLMSLGVTKVDEILEYSYKATTDPIKAILITGGYAYFDRRKKFIAANGLTPYGDVLFFSGPFKFPPGFFGGREGETVERAAALENMQEVTIPDMLKEPTCCARFGWLAREPSLRIFDGSFYYTYTEASGHEPNYFILMRSEDVQVVRPKYNDTPSIQYLDSLKELKKSAWQRSRLEFMELEKKRARQKRRQNKEQGPTASEEKQDD